MIEHPCLDALEHHAVSSLNMPVTLRVRRRSIADLDAESFAPIFELTSGELGAIISDDLVRSAESDHYVLEELFGLPGCDLGDRFGFNPLGELVDGDEEMSESSWRGLEWSDHVESPGGERPADRNGLEYLCRQVYLPGEELAALAGVHDGVGVRDRGWPEEALSIGFSNERSGRRMVAADP